MSNDCFVCNRIDTIIRGENPYFVAEFSTGYAVMGDFQFYNGYTIFLSKKHATELHELDKKIRTRFLEEMAQVAEGVYKAFQPKKLNYELLGNLDSHMHWHIFPRYEDDPDPKNPVSVIPPEIRNADSTRPSKERLKQLKSDLQEALQELGYLTSNS
jgi:diadenosine tetraphosphate (Ap4A) HIT family hydrolase